MSAEVGSWLVDNRRNWDARSAAHARSETYDTERYVRDPQYLSSVVRFDQLRLPSVQGLRGLHLQCHIGTDTVSLARLGAQMVGLDFSASAVAAAQSLSLSCGSPAQFVCADVYSAWDSLRPASFDFVYTGVGALCWLPDISRWAEVVAGLLRPGGWLFVREGHPMLWAIDERHSDRLVVDHPYFEQMSSTVMHEGRSHVALDISAPAMRTHEWNHGLGEIVSALLGQGMVVTGLTEHCSAPWEAIAGQMVCDEAGEWRLRDRPERLAATYTLQAALPAVR